MTQEDKELLLKDISGRFPYGLIVQISLFRNDGRKRDIDLDPHVTENIWEIIDNYQALPYLRPLSSMTEEEREELQQEHIKDEQLFCDCIKNHHEMRGLIIPHFAADWCNKNMFDYRGLIEKGLAIAVTNENNPYKE